MRCLFPKRASIFGALFFLVLPASVSGNCSTQKSLDWQQVRHVHDGDSLQLNDRRKIRLIGVNTPELARDGRPADPFARDAMSFTKTLVERANGRVGLIYDTDRKDHYGRTLAHVILPDRSNLTEQLLASGLGSHIAITPNLAFNDCYAQAQQVARKNKQNLWKTSNHIINDIDKIKTVKNGFHHVRGKITRIGEGKYNIWLNFGDKLAIRIARKDLDYFTEHPSSLLNKTIETSGWIYTAKGQQRLRVHHPSVIHQHD